MVRAKVEPDHQDRLEQQASLRRYDAETTGILEGNQDRRVNRKLRTKYADRVFLYLGLYSVFVGALLIWDGFGIWKFHLPDVVMSALVGSTAAAAIGLVGFVVNGLFKNLK